MADSAKRFRGSTRRSPNGSFSRNWTALLPGILVAAAIMLAGCNANQTLNPSGQRSLGAANLDYNPYNPIEYGQTSGFYAGR